MNETMEKYIQGFNKEGINFLRKNSEEVKKLESLEEIEELEFFKGTNLADDLLVLQYQAKAPSLFPSVRQRLIDKRIAKRHNMLHTSLKNNVYNVTMGFYGNSLQLSVDFSK